MTRSKMIITSSLLMTLLLIPASAFAGSPVEPNPNADVQIDAAGASFPFPLIDLWRVEYGELYPNVQLNYQSIGSGGGVKNHISKTVVFAASDAPLKPAESGFFAWTNVKDMDLIKQADGNYMIVVTNNNDRPQFFRYIGNKTVQ